jgi:hypothetical protein
VGRDTCASVNEEAGVVSRDIARARSQKWIATHRTSPKKKFARHQRSQQTLAGDCNTEINTEIVRKGPCIYPSKDDSSHVYLDITQGLDSAWPLLLSSPDQIGEVKSKRGCQFHRFKSDIRSWDDSKVESGAAVSVTDIFSLLVWCHALSHTAQHELHFADMC